MKVEQQYNREVVIVDYKLENNGDFKIRDKVYKDWRVNAYINKEFIHGWDNAYSKSKASELRKRLMNLTIASF